MLSSILKNMTIMILLFISTHISVANAGFMAAFVGDSTTSRNGMIAVGGGAAMMVAGGLMGNGLGKVMFTLGSIAVILNEDTTNIDIENILTQEMTFLKNTSFVQELALTIYDQIETQRKVYLSKMQLKYLPGSEILDQQQLNKVYQYINH